MTNDIFIKIKIHRNCEKFRILGIYILKYITSI